MRGGRPFPPRGGGEGEGQAGGSSEGSSRHRALASFMVPGMSNPCSQLGWQHVGCPPLGWLKDEPQAAETPGQSCRKSTSVSIWKHPGLGAVCFWISIMEPQNGLG